MIEHGAMTPSRREPQTDPESVSVSLGASGTTSILANRRVQAVVGVAALALIALAVGVPGRTLFYVGLLLLCPLMMLGMHGAHGGHHHHGSGDGAMAAGAGDTGSDHALDILRERYARGEIGEDEFERVRRTLADGSAWRPQGG